MRAMKMLPIGVFPKFTYVLYLVWSYENEGEPPLGRNK